MTEQEAIKKLREFCKLRAFCELYPDECLEDDCEIYMAIEALSCSEKPNESEPKTAESGSVDSEQPEIKTDRTIGGMIYRQDAIDTTWFEPSYTDPLNVLTEVRDRLKDLPSAQPEQRYTDEELKVFKHGISLSLLSKRSSQHWQYDEDTATEIKFLERLYEKVGADMRGEEDDTD